MAVRRPSFMDIALAEAAAAAKRGEVPVGAAVIDGRDGRVLASDGNRTEALDDASAHAELLALRAAAAVRGTACLADCDIYVTLEPCPMCAHAISLFRIRRLCYGAADAKGGAVEHGPRLYHQPTCHHAPEVYGGIAERRAGALLQAFFRERR